MALRRREPQTVKVEFDVMSFQQAQEQITKLTTDMNDAADRCIDATRMAEAATRGMNAAIERMKNVQRRPIIKNGP